MDAVFNAVNALFSGLAFVVLILTLFLQSRELQLQRQELEQTRAELQGQREQMETQNRTLRRQSFENTFFQLLRLHAEMVASMDIRGPGADANATVLARDCFVRYYKWFCAAYARVRQTNTSRPDELIIADAYDEFYSQRQSDVGHYFRSLYNMIKFVAISDLEDEEKRLYTNLVRAQLSSQELLLLFYNCLSRHGKDKFKPLVERFCLLKGLPNDQLLIQQHECLYDFRAFRKG